MQSRQVGFTDLKYLTEVKEIGRSVRSAKPSRAKGPDHESDYSTRNCTRTVQSAIMRSACYIMNMHIRILQCLVQYAVSGKDY